MAEQREQKMKFHAAIARALRDLHVDTVFGLIGDANLYAIDSYIRDYGGKFVSVAHEASSVLAALGYAQVSGKVGVASVTHGPALANTLTALIEGVKSAVPIVLLAGDTPIEDREHLQNVNQRELVTATGAGFEQLRSAATLSQDIAKAFRRSILERRPIVLNIPVDFQWLDVDYQPVRLYLPNNKSVVPESEDLDNAVGIIAYAKRPVILGGRGASHPEAKAAILRLSDRIGAPLVTTLRASGLFHGEDYNLGVCGTMATPAALEAITRSDCIIAFGASLNKFTTARGSLVRNKRVVQVNLERSEIGKYHEPDVGLVGDSALTADAIVQWLDVAEVESSAFRSELLENEIAVTGPTKRTADSLRPGTVDIGQALSVLNDAVSADRVLVTDVGRFVYEAWAHFSVQDPGSFVYAFGFASIGFGVAEALGAAQAAGERPTVLIVGDGGFMLGGLTEFNSAVRSKSDIIIIVCNDSGYGAEYVQFRNKNMDPSLSVIQWPDLAPVADALGGGGLTVRNLEDLEAATKAIKGRDRTRPLLIDIKLDPDFVPTH